MRRLDRLTRIPGTLSLLLGIAAVILQWLCWVHHLPLILFFGAFLLVWVAVVGWGLSVRKYLRERAPRSKP